MKVLRIALFLGATVVVLAGCGGEEPVAAPVPTPTAVPLTLGGSPLDAVDNNSTLMDQQAPLATDDPAYQENIEPNAVDCEVHATDPSMCVGAGSAPAADGYQAVRFDSSLWDFEMNGFTVFTNVTEPYPIEDVVAATIEATRAEFTGENQALFPYLASRRTAPKYAEVGIWSVTFLFANNPTDDPAEVNVAVEGTTADGEKFDDLITFRWQWTEERWIPEWEALVPESSGLTESPSDSADSTDLEGDSTNGSGDSTGDGDSANRDSDGSGTGSDTGGGVGNGLPPSGATFCPPGFPYAHYNGQCYANPINPLHQIGGPQVTVEQWELFVENN